MATSQQSSDAAIVVEDAPIMFTSVYQAFNAVMADVRAVGKDDFNQQQNFAFRGIDATINAVGPALREHGVIIVPQEQLADIATEYQTTRGNTRMVNRMVKIRWRVYGPHGDWFEGESWGEAADSGDKAMSKAQSVAYRVFLLQALCIPTGDRDPDADAHERAGSSQGEGYFNEEEARKERESLEASNQARAELLSATEPYGWDPDKLLKRFRQDYRTDLLAVRDLAVINGFKEALVAEAKAQEAEQLTAALGESGE